MAEERGISVKEDLLNEIHSHGDRGAVVSFSRIGDLKRDMLDLKNGDYHTDWLDRMANHMIEDTDNFIPSDIDFEPRSLISIVMPSPKMVLQFSYRNCFIPCVVPPHYTNFYANNERALHYIKGYLAPFGYSVAMTITIPQKLLAVHCGLALYGRNNICYNEEFGSYMQIMTYISDLPSGEAPWFPIRRMQICEQCSACVSSCPTGAIDSNRCLINSDKCITLFDESPGEFPEWLDKEAHNSIVGCTKCQDCCPGNAHNKGNIKEGVTFTEVETIELMNNQSDVSYSDSLASKIMETGIPSEYSKPCVLPRNLAALLHKQNILKSRVSRRTRYD